MAETVKTQSALLTEMADGGDNTAEEVRNGIVSMWTPGWVRYLDHRLPDETAHADDQFFAEGAPAAPAGGTALTVSGSATWLEGRSSLSVIASGQSTNDAAARIYGLTPTTAPVTIETAIDFLGPNAGGNGLWCGIGFCDGSVAGSNIAAATVQTNGSGGVFLENSGTFTAIVNGGSVAIGQTLGGRIYVRFVWTAANTFAMRVSKDGISWADPGSLGTLATTLTPTDIFVYATVNGSGNPVYASFHYIRVYESDLS